MLLAFSALAQGNPTTPPPTHSGTRYAYLGVFLGDAPAGKGAVVGKVVADSPAAKAGLQANDVILQFDKTTVEGAAHVYRLLGETQPNSTALLNVQRTGAALTIAVHLGERLVPLDGCQKLYATAELKHAEANRLRQLAEEAQQKGQESEAKKYLEEAAAYAKQAALDREDIDRAISAGQVSECRPAGKPTHQQFGLNVLPLTEQLAQAFKVKDSAGWLITEVKAGSLAEQQGLKVGDCLLSANGKRLASLSELNRLLNREHETAAKAVEIILVIVRDGQEQTLKFSLP